MSGTDPLRLAILISGRGSNMVAIARACAEGRINARVAVVVSERPGIAGLDAARDLGIEARTVAWPGAGGASDSRATSRRRSPLRRPTSSSSPDSCASCHERFVAAHAGRILNIHPSLLPKYRGLHTHRRVLEAGERCTVPACTSSPRSSTAARSSSSRESPCGRGHRGHALSPRSGDGAHDLSPRHRLARRRQTRMAR